MYSGKNVKLIQLFLLSSTLCALLLMQGWQTLINLDGFAI